MNRNQWIIRQGRTLTIAITKNTMPKTRKMNNHIEKTNTPKKTTKHDNTMKTSTTKTKTHKNTAETDKKT